MRMSASLAVLFVSAIVLLPGVGRAQECDASFKAEYTLCKADAKEFQEGLEKKTRSVFTDCKPVQPAKGCEFTKKPGYTLIVVTPADFEPRGLAFQCTATPAMGKLFTEKDIAYMMPGFWITDFPGESNSDRTKRYNESLKKDGKKLLHGVAGGGAKTTCQYWNAKTQKVLYKVVDEGK
jgi:predicted nucleic acid-binding Zn ribbon protein